MYSRTLGLCVGPKKKSKSLLENLPASQPGTEGQARGDPIGIYPEPPRPQNHVRISFPPPPP